MPNLPPLPLVDGCLLVDNSMLELLTTCPRALQYNRLSKRTVSATKSSLSFGTAGHLVWEHRYRNVKNGLCTPMDEEAQVALLEKHFAENPPPEDDFRNLNWAVEVCVKKYNQTYGLEPFSILTDAKGNPMVELSFALPLFTYFPSGPEIVFVPNGIPIIYTGRIDLPVLWDNQIIVIDHKTTSMLGPTFWDDQRVSPQQLGYAWAFQELTKQPVSGFCINAVRVRPIPARPVGGIDNWWSENFQRFREYISAAQLTEWKNNVIALIEEFFWHYSRDFMPQKKKWCCGKYGKCQYYEVCDTPADQRDMVLSSGTFMDNNWSPLKQPIKV